MPAMYDIAPERPAEAAAIEALLDRAFGPDRNAKTVYRLRQDVAPIANLCFTLKAEGRLVASIRHWPVDVGLGAPALMLGPVAVDPDVQGKGYGKALIWHSLNRARQLGWGFVLLVGDPEYYGPFGFERGPVAALGLPGPVEVRRFLGLELRPGAAADAAGTLRRWPGPACPPYRPSRYQASMPAPTKAARTSRAGSSGIWRTPATT